MTPPLSASTRHVSQLLAAASVKIVVPEDAQPGLDITGVIRPWLRSQAEVGAEEFAAEFDHLSIRVPAQVGRSDHPDRICESSRSGSPVKVARISHPCFLAVERTERITAKSLGALLGAETA